jgi:hypothetical protein
MLVLVWALPLCIGNLIDESRIGSAGMGSGAMTVELVLRQSDAAGTLLD